MVLRAEAIELEYTPGTPVLRRVDAVFLPGEVTAIVGPNGAGKSSLLRILLGSLPPTAGRATLAGLDTHRLAPGARASRIAYMPQHERVAFDFETLAFVRFGLGGTPDRGEADRALDAVGLKARARTPISHLSAGQRQRASLARVLTQAARFDGGGVVLADEPVAAMDAGMAQSAFSILRDQAARGLTVVLVLHDLHAALRACDRVLLMDGSGRVASWDRPRAALNPDALREVYGVTFEEVRDAQGNLLALLPPLPPVRDRGDRP
ncbi:MAG: ABC transporter ATP-binding protein [Phycisphaeraceae bacterium]|nr:MAG: ABC transporter ATP-binding protein [Phycisphaeraceae bacterium]